MTRKTSKKNKADQEAQPLAQQELCPDYCPFLHKQAIHCRLFNMPLMASPPLIYKCRECMDADTRKSTYKKKVKEYEKRVYMWDKAAKRKPFDLRAKIKVTLADWKDRKVFKDFLMALAGKLPILTDGKLSKLLLNLYLVLDSTEKQEMKDILSNPQTAEILIKKIHSVGRSPDLLKQVRKEMDNIILKRQKEMEALALQQAKAHQMSR